MPPVEYWIAYKVDGQPYASGPYPGHPELAITAQQRAEFEASYLARLPGVTEVQVQERPSKETT